MHANAYDACTFYKASSLAAFGMMMTSSSRLVWSGWWKWKGKGREERLKWSGIDAETVNSGSDRDKGLGFGSPHSPPTPESS